MPETTPTEAPEAQAEQKTDDQAASWTYDSEAASDPGAQPPTTLQQTVSWTASEFIDHQKNSGWYLVLVGATILVITLVYVLSHSIFTSVLIAIMAVLLGITAARKPRTLPYQIDAHGIQVGNKAYGYDAFRSFSVVHEGAISSIQLQPLKRFSLALSLYYPPEQEDEIINALGSFLPHEERALDPIDRLSRKIRF